MLHSGVGKEQDPPPVNNLCCLQLEARSGPSLLPCLVQELGKQNPHLFSLITQNQSEFMRLLSEPANAAPANPQAADLAAQLAAAAGGDSFVLRVCWAELDTNSVKVNPGPMTIHYTPEGGVYALPSPLGCMRQFRPCNSGASVHCTACMAGLSSRTPAVGSPCEALKCPDDNACPSAVLQMASCTWAGEPCQRIMHPPIAMSLGPVLPSLTLEAVRSQPG